jgi:hypothetical protein
MFQRTKLSKEEKIAVIQPNGAAGYLHCSEELVEKACRKSQLCLSKRWRPPVIPTE